MKVIVEFSKDVEHTDILQLFDGDIFDGYQQDRLDTLACVKSFEILSQNCKTCRECKSNT